ncbi:Ankyrin repeat-containing protein [Sinomonas atrocyanea]|uniref:Ankyrin repeat-containing protein n=2 Tax=Sinomonas atrocyanea TaxID=37927 RepID=A0A127A515_9MICC|nr:ankyrin repeat domain-containing protein [Sinomonas atrocyanea]AMM33725.1 Ankyrin repeat-containing protein [Sinomonas atrocyanea]GEB66421.1 putative ankyrin-like protein [Sinomonas atrocyanea]GGG74889.1 putative ankyrin-like protein [Sinomonas atrocyanea]
MSENAQTPGASGMPEDVIALAGKLFDAARAGDTPVLRAYLEAGAPATLANQAGDTLVMLAAYHGHAESVRLLGAHGADVAVANDRGQTPLAGAVFKGHADVVEVLLELGADPDAGSPTARQAAHMFGRSDLVDRFGTAG